MAGIQLFGENGVVGAPSGAVAPVAAAPPTQGEPRTYEYDAFMSYSHAADDKLAPVLESELRRFAKPFWQRRSLRVFRDETTLKLTEHLWPTIKAEIDKSRCFILLASPEAAQSKWVDKEVAYWLETRGAKNLFIVLTSGTIKWGDSDFDWAKTDALSHVLAGRFADEPKWASATSLKAGGDLVARNPVLRTTVAILYAAIKDRPVDDVIGDDNRQHGRFRLFLFLMSACFAGLAALAGVIYVSLSNDARLEAKARLTSELARGRTQSGDAVLSAGMLLETLQSEPSLLKTSSGPEIRWGLLNALHSAREQVMLGHHGEIKRLVLSRDGANFATVTLDDKAKRYVARVWSAATFERFGELEHGGEITSAAFSSDGQRLLTASRDKTVRVWDWRAGSIVTLDGGDVRKAAFRPADGAISTVTRQGEFCLAAATAAATAGSSREVVCAVRPEFATNVSDFDWTTDGSAVATVATDGTVALWRPDTGQRTVELPLPKTPGADVLRSWRIEVNQKGTRVVVARQEGERHKIGLLWDVQNQVVLKTIEAPTDNWINAFAFSADGNALAVVMRNLVRLFDATTGEPRAYLIGHTSFVSGAQFSPNGKLVVTWSADHTARIWSATDGRLRQVLGGHGAWVRRAVFSSDGCNLVTVSDDATARVWSMGAATAQIRLSADGSACSDQRRLFSGAMSADGKLVATASADGHARIFDANSAALLKEFSQSQEVQAVAFSPDATLLATGEGSQELSKARIPSRVYVRDWRSGAAHELPVAGGRVRTVSFSHDGRYLAAAVADGTALIWRVSAGVAPMPVAKLAHGSDPLTSAVWNSDSTRIITTAVHPDKRACVWDLGNLGTGTVGAMPLGCTKKATDSIWHAAWSSDDRRFAMVDGDNYIKVFDSKTFIEIASHRLDGDLYAVHVAFAPGDGHLMLAGVDGVLSVLQVGSWRSVYAIEDTSRISSFVISGDSGDGRRLLTTHVDGSAKIAPLWLTQSVADLVKNAEARVARCLSADQRQRLIGRNAVAPDWCAVKWQKGASAVYRVTPMVPQASAITHAPSPPSAPRPSPPP